MFKYLRLLKYELKNILSDSMSKVMLIYPIFIIIVGAYFLPILLERFGDDTPGTQVAALVMIIFFASIAPFITAAMLGFNLLDNRDDNTIDTIRVTPISLRGYITFKSIYAYILSVNASFFVMFGTKHLSGDGYTVMGINLFDNFTAGWIFIYAVVAGLFTPLFGLLLSAFAKNKIEGFAFMKASGMIIIVPALAVIETMQDAKQYFLGIIPIFWPVKGLMTSADLLVHSSNLDVWLYMVIGILYMIVLIIIFYKIFDRKLQG